MSIYELYDLLKSAAVFKPENEYCISAIFRTGKAVMAENEFINNILK